MRGLIRYAPIAGVVLGLAIIGSGAFFIAKGLDAKANIEAALLQEEVITSKDAPIAGVIVQDAATASAQQDAVEAHTFGRFGPYSGMDRDDPNREVYLKGLTIRNSLNLAVLGFGVADMAIGTGAVMILLGFAMSGSAVTALYLMRRPDAVSMRELIPSLATRSDYS